MSADHYVYVYTFMDGFWLISAAVLLAGGVALLIIAYFKGLL